MSDSKKNTYNLLEILNQLLNKQSYSDIANELNIAVGTVKRWVELNNVPKSYTFELLKLANINIDYSQFEYKDKDQFFTPIKTAKYCYNKFIEILHLYGDDVNSFTFIEPAAGDGRFLELLPENKRIGDVKTTTGEKVKRVNYSVLYMKAIKALQEAMAKIETLETKVKALEDA